MPRPVRRKTSAPKLIVAKYPGEKPSRSDIATNMRAMVAGFREQISELRDQIAKDSTSELAKIRSARIEELETRAGKLLKAAEEFES